MKGSIIIISIGILFLFQVAKAWVTADYGADCSRIRCKEEKNLVCSRNYVCECKIDEILHTPWIFVRNLDRCVASFRDDVPFGGQYPQPGHPHGHNHGGIGRPQPNPTSTLRCTSLDSHSPCLYSKNCQQQFGNLAQCSLHERDPSLNRCECCHPTDETGFYNGRCHYVKRLGQSCTTDEECILGYSNSRCRRGVCQQRGYGNTANPTYSSSFYIAITLIISAIFATKVVAAN